MKAWPAAPASEIKDRPQVTRESFFGFTARYRCKYMFGLLPRKCSFFNVNAVGFPGANRGRQGL